jgi:hypothetical protein
MKKKLVKVVVVSLLFAAADAWIFSTLARSFHSYNEAKNVKEVSLFARTAPAGGDYAAWLGELDATIEGARALV